MAHYWIKGCTKCRGDVTIDSYGDRKCMNCGVIYDYGEKITWPAQETCRPQIPQAQGEFRYAYKRNNKRRGRPTGWTPHI